MKYLTDKLIYSISNANGVAFSRMGLFRCMRLSRFRLIGGLVSCLLATTSPIVFAQTSTDSSDWPCIQQLVPDVNIAVVWPLPIKDDIKGQWSKDNAISQLAHRLGDIDEVTDDIRSQITDFAEAIPEADRSIQLSTLADGIVDVTNNRRQLFIKGIQRYTRQQKAIARQVQEQLNKLDELEGQTSDDAIKHRQELEETARWHQRVFDQREQTISALCDRPVELESTMGDVLREVAQFLP